MDNLDDIKAFISTDRLTIQLPVPLDSIVYGVNTKCCDACLFQKAQKEKNPGALHCGTHSPCHTMALQPSAIELNMFRLEDILCAWNDLYFATEEEAVKRTNELVEIHIALMTFLGFSLDDKGYSFINKKS